MDLFKVLIIGIVVALLSVFLKSVKPEYSLVCLIAGSIVIMMYIANSISNLFGFFGEIVNKTGVDNKMFVTLIKIIGIGYLIEFSAGVCADSGNNSIADKIVLSGKLLIFTLSMPIITSLFNMVLEFVK